VCACVRARGHALMHGCEHVQERSGLNWHRIGSSNDGGGGDFRFHNIREECR
jgi:hypothetical protein